MRYALAIAVTVGCLARGTAGPSTASQQARPPEDVLLARFAIELAAERDAEPVSLDAGGHGVHGVAYDRFTHAHLAARVAQRKGAPLDPLKPPAALLSKLLIVVAVPLACGDRTVKPVDVDIDSSGRTVPKWLPATGAMIQTLLPGAVTPAGAIAVQFSDTSLVAGDVVRISYATAVCSGSAKVVSLPASVTPPRALDRPLLDMAAGEAPSRSITLTIAGVVDLDGRLRYATAPEASSALGARALSAAEKMRFEPARINGSPTPWTAGVVLTFGAGGVPAFGAGGVPAFDAGGVPVISAADSARRRPS